MLQRFVNSECKFSTFAFDPFHNSFLAGTREGSIFQYSKVCTWSPSLLFCSCAAVSLPSLLLLSSLFMMSPGAGACRRPWRWRNLSRKPRIPFLRSCYRRHDVVSCSHRCLLTLSRQQLPGVRRIENPSGAATREQVHLLFLSPCVKTTGSSREGASETMYPFSFFPSGGIPSPEVNAMRLGDKRVCCYFLVLLSSQSSGATL